MKILKYFLGLLCLIQFFSCGKDCESCDPIIINQQLEFANLGQAHEQLFRLDSVLVVGFPGDTVKRSYLLKELISEDSDPSFALDVFRVDRFLSRDQGNSFYQSELSQYQFLHNDVTRNYGNLPFKVLELPFKENKKWNGAAYFNPDGLQILVNGEPMEFFKNDWYNDFTYTSFNLFEEVEGTGYDSVITVRQGNYEALNEIRYSIEKYAWKVGLIYKELSIFDESCSQVGSDTCRTGLDWVLRGERGFHMKQWRIN
jgi:hypothetical protein